MEHRTEEGNPVLKLRSSITTNPKHWYMSYNKSNNPLSNVYMTQLAVIKKNIKGKRCKVQSACV